MKDYVVGVSREFHDNRMSIAYCVMDPDKNIIDSQILHIHGDIIYLDKFFAKIVSDLEEKYKCEVLLETYTNGVFEPASQKSSRNNVMSRTTYFPPDDLPYNEHGHHNETLHVLVKPCPEFIKQLKSLKIKK